jgi:hypothetical protein
MGVLDGPPIIDGALLQAVEEEHSGSYDGPGVSKFRNGNTYDGEFRERTMNGRGEYVWTNLGVSYSGAFDRNRMRGEGKYSWPDGSTYEGQVLDGLRDGYGVYTGPHGMCRYSGEWRGGHRHGMGKLEYDLEGKSFYEGQWETDEKHGQVRRLRWSRDRSRRAAEPRSLTRSASARLGPSAHTLCFPFIFSSSPRAFSLLVSLRCPPFVPVRSPPQCSHSPSPISILCTAHLPPSISGHYGLQVWQRLLGPVGGQRQVRLR